MTPRRAVNPAVYWRQGLGSDLSVTFQTYVGSPKYPAFILDLEVAIQLRDMLSQRIAQTQQARSLGGQVKA